MSNLISIAALCFNVPLLFNKVLVWFLNLCLKLILLHNSLLKNEKIAKPLLFAFFTCLVPVLVFWKLFTLICLCFMIYLFRVAENWHALKYFHKHAFAAKNQISWICFCVLYMLNLINDLFLLYKILLLILALIFLLTCILVCLVIVFVFMWHSFLTAYHLMHHHGIILMHAS